MKKIVLFLCTLYSMNVFSYSWQIHNDTDTQIIIEVNVSGLHYELKIPAHKVHTLNPHNANCLTSFKIKDGQGHWHHLPWDKQTTYIKEGLLLGLVGIITIGRVLRKLCSNCSISIYEDARDGNTVKWGIIDELVNVGLPGAEDEDSKPDKKKDTGTPPPPQQIKPTINLNGPGDNPEYHGR
ncbi:MAG: hypothetical protein WCE21_00010 [Candidatus Babeliales bacterium]